MASSDRVEAVAKILFDEHFWADDDPVWYREVAGFDEVIKREQNAGAFDRNRYMKTARKIVEEINGIH